MCVVIDLNERENGDCEKGFDIALEMSEGGMVE